MIFEGSCDTEDWSNDAENSALITVLHFTKYSNRKQFFWIVIIFHNITFFFVCFFTVFTFKQINAAMVSRRHFFQKHDKSYWLQSFEW